MFSKSHPKIGILGCDNTTLLNRNLVPRFAEATLITKSQIIQEHNNKTFNLVRAH